MQTIWGVFVRTPPHLGTLEIPYIIFRKGVRGREQGYVKKKWVWPYYRSYTRFPDTHLFFWAFFVFFSCLRGKPIIVENHYFGGKTRYFGTKCTSVGKLKIFQLFLREFPNIKNLCFLVRKIFALFLIYRLFPSTKKIFYVK